MPAAAKHRPDDARQFVGQRDHGRIPVQPSAQSTESAAKRSGGHETRLGIAARAPWIYSLRRYLSSTSRDGRQTTTSDLMSESLHWRPLHH